MGPAGEVGFCRSWVGWGSVGGKGWGKVGRIRLREGMRGGGKVGCNSRRA